MLEVSPKGARYAVGALGAWLGWMLAALAPAQMLQPLDTKQMVTQADQIVVGQCLEKKVGIQDNHLIVTQYKIKPEEFWKGQATLDSDGTFSMSEVGGSLEGKSSLPIAQYSPGGTEMLAGESVLLFLANPTSASSSARSRVATDAGRITAGVKRVQDTPKVVGRWQGRFSVVTNPKSGSRFVARTNVSTVPGSPINAEMSQTLLKAQGLKVTTTAKGDKVVVHDDRVRPSQEKIDKLAAQLDKAAKTAREEHESKLRRVSSSGTVQDNTIYSLESMDQVKAAVLRLVKETKK